MGMRLVIHLRPFTLNILVKPLDTEGNNERVRGGWRGVGVERKQDTQVHIQTHNVILVR